MVDDRMTDGQIIWASRRDPRRFAEIFTRHFDAVHRYLYRRVGRGPADDLASATFLEAFEHRDRYDPGRANARPWLLGIATNLLRHHLREERDRLAAYARVAAYAGTSSAPEGPGFEGSEDRLDAQRAVPRLVQALLTLDARDRDVLLLYAWGDLSYREIGEALSIPTGTVRSRLHRVRRQIREHLGPQLAMKQGGIGGSDR